MMGTLLFVDLWVCCSYLELNPFITYGKHNVANLACLN